MRLLLLQARSPGDPAEAHEQLAFREVIGQGDRVVQPWSLLQGPPGESVLAQTDCILVGGAGEYGVGDAARHTWMAEFIDFIGEIAERNQPIFASCLGFQALVVALGGRVETDKSRAEIGTFEVTVTQQGNNDPLFTPLFPRFDAQLGHKDHAVELPPAVVHLASSERSPYQALKIPGKPVYATQFHPELSMQRNRERFVSYLEKYSSPEMADDPERVLSSFRDSAASTTILQRYIDEILPAYL
jgi:GMP synthase (glutamine-hydrolysing)